MPPQCRPECVVSSECPQDRACVKQKCVDPCPGTCGANAICKVVNHNAICSCARGFTGDPFIGCNRAECKLVYYYLLYIPFHILSLYSLYSIRISSYMFYK